MFVIFILEKICFAHEYSGSYLRVSRNLMFLHEFRNERREGDAVSDSALDQQAQGSGFNTQHGRKHISEQNKMWAGLRGEEKAVRDHFLFSQHAWHILSSGSGLSDLRPFFHLNPFSYSVNPFLMFRMKQTSSSVHWTLISKPWRSLSYCTNLFSPESLWTCSPPPSQDISLNREICDSLWNVSFWCVF